MSEPENRPAPSAMATAVARMLLLERAAGYVGQAKLAAAIGIEERSLRKKFTADRGVTDADLEAAAGAIEVHAWQMIGHAAKMRGMVA